jgi:hypothetical protein
VEVTWTRYREAPPQHGRAREAGLAPAHHAACLALLTGTKGNPFAVAVRSSDLLTAIIAPAA